MEAETSFSKFFYGGNACQLLRAGARALLLQRRQMRKAKRHLGVENKDEATVESHEHLLGDANYSQFETDQGQETQRTENIAASASTQMTARPLGSSGECNRNFSNTWGTQGPPVLPGICEALKAQAISLLYERKRASGEKKRKRTRAVSSYLAERGAAPNGDCREAQLAEELNEFQFSRNGFNCELIPAGAAECSDRDQRRPEWLNDRSIPTPNSIPVVWEVQNERLKRFPVSVPGPPLKCALNSADMMRGLWALRSDPTSSLASETFGRFITQCIEMCSRPSVSFKSAESSILPNSLVKQIKSTLQLLKADASLASIVEGAWVKIASALLHESSPSSNPGDVCRWYARPALMELLFCLVDDSSGCLSCFKTSLCISAICRSLLASDLAIIDQDNVAALFCILEKAIQAVHPACYAQSCESTNWNVTLDEVLQGIAAQANRLPVLFVLAENSASLAEGVATAAANHSLVLGSSRAALALQSHGVQLSMPPPLRLFVQLSGTSGTTD